ncbi:TetR family transcriptional regulator [Streptomyces canus]|uniref:TetR family transcriptional regulator n=1 Tax=Streptomyces canus TaxID=58343 RepID=UPI003865F655|nr:TetR/AcrR family transcriptional regulator [Streptomyces canus]
MKQPVQSRGRVTRDKILSAAADLFAKNGYLKTDVQDIVKAAEVGRGAFYHQFRNSESDGGAKELVARAVVTESFVVEFVPQTVLPRVQAVVDASILLAVATPRVTVVRAALRIALEQGHPLYGFLWDGYIPVVTQWLTEAYDLGELQPGVDPREAATALVDGYTGRDARKRYAYRELPWEMAKFHQLIYRAIVTPETYAKLDLSVDRGLELFRNSAWAGLDELQAPAEAEASAGLSE